MLPDGREEVLAAKIGQTVQYTKAVMSEKFALPIEQLVSTAKYGYPSCTLA